jgi:hypothetical protein
MKKMVVMMILDKPKVGDRVTWEHVNLMLSSQPLVRVEHLEVLEILPLTHVSTIHSFGRFMLLIRDSFGKVWPVGSKFCYKEA